MSQDEKSLANVVILPKGELLIVGLKQSFENLLTPSSDEGPMDHPTRGLVIQADVADLPSSPYIEGGSYICHFEKFKAAEVQIEGQRYFVVKASEVRAWQEVTEEESKKLLQNTF